METVVDSMSLNSIHVGILGNVAQQLRIPASLVVLDNSDCEQLH
jgi:hypothetical protein